VYIYADNEGQFNSFLTQVIDARTSFFLCSKCSAARYDNKVPSSWKLHHDQSPVPHLPVWYTLLLIIRLFERPIANVYYFLLRAILFSVKRIAQVIIAATAGGACITGKFVIISRLINPEDIPSICTHPDRLKRAALPFSKLRPRFIWRVIKSAAGSST